MERLKRILFLGDPDPLILFMGIGAFLWGGLLALPVDTFGSSPSYNLMAYIADEFTWGISIMAVSVVKIYVLLFNDSYYFKFWVNLFMFCVWVFVSVSFIIANPVALSTVTYPSFALAALWCSIRRLVQHYGRVENKGV